MCGINNILAFKGGKNHKRNGYASSFGITIVVVVSCKGSIQDRLFYVAPVYVHIWPELIKVLYSKSVKYTHK